jgi:hypothetical protein
MKITLQRLIVETWAALRTLAVLGTAAFVAAGCSDAEIEAVMGSAEAELTTNTGELVCSGPNCACSSNLNVGLGFIQGTDGTGSIKNFELAVPRTQGGFSAYWRNNDLPPDVPSREWRGAITATSTGDINGLSLLENKVTAPGIPGAGNLEVVAVRDGTLVHFYRDRVTKAWSSGLTIPGSAGVTGQPGFVQNDASHKNFEVVVPRTAAAGGGLAHFWRNNTNSNFQWNGPFVFATGVTSVPFEAVSLIESDYDVNRLEVVARAGTQLFTVWREGNSNWSTPRALVPDNTGPILATGVPSFTQRQVPSPGHGNFELLVPLVGGGIRHFFRDNRELKVPTDPEPFYQWSASNTWVDQTTRPYSAAAVIHATGFDSPLNAVGRRSDDGSLAAFFYNETTNSWQSKGNDINGAPLWAGAVFGGEPCCNPVTKGVWQNPLNSGAIGIHAALLKTGKVLFFGFGNNSHEGYSEIFDPTNGAITLPAGPVVPHAFCAGHAFLNDGKLWVAGGHEGSVADSHVFDPDTSTWLHQPEGGLGTEEEHAGRWYPTLARLPDGSVFAISGAVHANRLGATLHSVHNGEPNPVNDTYQIMSPSPGMSLGLRFDIGTTFGGDTIKLYPFVFQLPSGQLFVHSLTASRLLTITSEGPSWGPEITTEYDFSRIYPGSGSAVLLPLSPPDYRAKIMLFGGGGDVPQSGPAQDSDANIPATNSVELLDLGEPTPDWVNVNPMNHARVLATAVLLPDGKVFVVGGSTHGSSDTAPKPVMIPEIYDPAANTWTEMCPMRVARLYHSTALLLPDARVLTAGRDDDFNMAPYTWPERRVEIFSPPYLTSGNPRPGIQMVATDTSSDPGIQWGYNQNFGLILNNAVSAANITRVGLMSPGAVTHAFDMSQRAIVLTAGGMPGNTILGSTPLNSMVAPPGWYMLFVVSDLGVPSIATWVQLR